MARCRVEFELSARQGDGASLRTHLQRQASSTGKVDPRLNAEWPPAGRALWDHFCLLYRAPSMNGMERITALDLLAHQALHQIRFTAWELEIISAFEAVAAEANTKQGK